MGPNALYGSCQVGVGAAGRSFPWLLILPAALLIVRRSRR
jgi:hypothetical protein